MISIFVLYTKKIFLKNGTHFDLQKKGNLFPPLHNYYLYGKFDKGPGYVLSQSAVEARTLTRPVKRPKSTTEVLAYDFIYWHFVVHCLWFSINVEFCDAFNFCNLIRCLSPHPRPKGKRGARSEWYFHFPQSSSYIPPYI